MENRAAGLLLILSFIAMAVGIGSFLLRGGVDGGGAPALERGAIMVAVVCMAMAFTLLDVLFQGTEGYMFGRLGLSVFLVATPVWLVAEGLALDGGERSVYPLVVTFVMLALAAQAAIGVALIQSQLVPVWIGWTTLVWNLALMILLPVVTPDDVYYPVAHILILPLIAVPLLVKG